jgi:hypothetical protein
LYVDNVDGTSSVKVHVEDIFIVLVHAALQVQVVREAIHLPLFLLLLPHKDFFLVKGK